MSAQADVVVWSSEFDRTPPQDVAAEQCVLGGMMLSKDAIADVIEVLHSGDFYKPAHQLVYDAIIDLYGRGEPADAVTVAAELTKRGEIGRVGGAPYLHTLISVVPTAGNAGYYAAIVRDRAILRRLVEAGTRIAQMGYAGDGDVDQICDAGEAAVFAATERRSRASANRSPAEILPGVLDEIDAIGKRGTGLIGTPTGYVDLDAITGGWHPGQLIIVAARPGVGKTTIALTGIRAACTAGRPVMFFSLEMGENDIFQRLLSATTDIPLDKIRSGKLGDGHWQEMGAASDEIGRWPLLVNDSPHLTVTEIRARARRAATRPIGLDAVVVDYLQLLQSGKRVESRQVEVSEFSRQLKLLAKEPRVPVIALSQLNRQPEQRTDKRPMLSDLRESGSLEMDADVVVLIHREDAYDQGTARAGEADLIVAKHRNGPTATVTVAHQLHLSRFVDMWHDR